MKRVFKLLVLSISILCLSVSASAVMAIEPFSINTNTYTLFLTFSGNTAYCDLTITGATGTTHINNCTITLKESNGTPVSQWTNLSASGTKLTASRTASVSTGKTYVLSFSATVHRNGVAEPISGSITRTYN